MINLVKSQDYFEPSMLKNQRVHIIGCGSVGSTVAELLARLGITKISLYDFDRVSAHNIANQMFFEKDIGRPKIEAVKDIIVSINSDIAHDVELHPEGYTETTKLSGYVFLCVDNIDLRREIVTKNQFNQSVKAMFDFRTRLEDAQHYAANWSKADDYKNLLNSMQFTHEEAHEATPVTACNVEMGVASTVRIICSYGVANFMNFIRNGNLKRIMVVDAFNFNMEVY